MKKFYKVLNFTQIFRFSSENLLFSNLFSEKKEVECDIHSKLFLDLTIKPEKELVSILNSNSNSLKSLKYTEKLILFEKLAKKQPKTKENTSYYSLELIESIISDLSLQNNDFLENLLEFLEKSQSIELFDKFPKEFLYKLSIKIQKVLISKKIDAIKKWYILEKLSLMKSIIYAGNFFHKPIIDFFYVEIPNISKSQLKVLIKLISKTNKNDDNNKDFMDFIHSNEFIQKIQDNLYQEWDCYIDIVKIINNNEYFNISDVFLNSLPDFLICEISNSTYNCAFFLKHLNYILIKYQKNINNMNKTSEQKEILLKLLENNADLTQFHLVLSIFLKLFKNELASIQHILLKISRLDLQNETINELLSVLSLIIRLSSEEDITNNKWSKDKCSLIINNILRVLYDTDVQRIDEINSKSLANFFNSVNRIMEKNEIHGILANFLDKTVFHMRNERFKFPTLLNILRIYSEMQFTQKHFYVILEEKIMNSLENIINSINPIDFLMMKKAFKNSGHGSRKLNIFLESVLNDKSPDNIADSYAFYKKREAKYQDFKEKKRKSYKYANKSRRILEKPNENEEDEEKQ